jgi:type I restriction enzyme R subunit
MPVVYYTNGFETNIIDGLGYPARTIYGLHTRQDLQKLIQKRGRQDIIDMQAKDEIVNRPYQTRAVKRVCEHFNLKHRRALLVMATGTGKTRVSIALVEVLLRNNWVKNVLFLADRTDLVKQARKSYEALLPSESMTSLSDDAEPDLEARFVFSTYQTMINYINDVDVKFSVGHFDLIIIDEAHRSVFGTYKAIFDYFDSLLIGLTATPRDEIDRSTFALLELDNNEPNFEYTFDEAVKDGYLVPYKAKVHNSKIINNGIKYNDLTEEQRNELEKVWEYEKMLKGIPQDKEYHRDIEGNEIFRYLINDDTIDNVLTELMNSGLKIKSGEDIGKTIIFAYNHKHAERIVERFRALYPNRGPHYCELIDNQVKNHSELIENFKVPDMMPQIAVSVDMLDTGIDVPEVLNLVFFKIVKSKIKFEQMIGRGTRLCANIFGQGKDKKEFYIFDWCGNFEYFSENPETISSTNSKSLTERLFALRLDIAKELQSADHQDKDYDRNMHDELKTMLHQQVNSIVKERKDVREYWNIIEPFRDKDSWTYLSEIDVTRLKKIGKLIPEDGDEEKAKQFDVIMLHLQLAHINSTVRVGQFRQVVVNIAASLEKKGTIPAVMEHIDIIRKVQKPQFWEHESLDSLECVRTELRSLIKLLEDSRKKEKFIIDIEDPYETVEGVDDVVITSTYKQRVVDYLYNNTNNATLRKIKDFEQLTHDDIVELERIFFEELGTKEDYNKLAEGHPYKNNVAAYIRVINGIDRKKALQIYRNFIQDTNLTANQELYLKNILDYVSENGDIETRNFTEYPLKSLSWRATFGNNFVKLKDFVKEIHKVIS